MVYGIGVSTEKGRCLPFFELFVQCTKEAEMPLTDCTPQLEDYRECLTHDKEVHIILFTIRKPG